MTICLSAVSHLDAGLAAPASRPPPLPAITHLPLSSLVSFPVYQPRLFQAVPAILFGSEILVIDLYALKYLKASFFFLAVNVAV